MALATALSPSRMLKKIRQQRSRYAQRLNVEEKFLGGLKHSRGLFRSPRLITRANGPHEVCGTYLLASSLAAALPGASRVLARHGWAGEKSGLFEHPTWWTPVIPDVQTSEIPACHKVFPQPASFVLTLFGTLNRVQRTIEPC